VLSLSRQAFLTPSVGGDGRKARGSRRTETTKLFLKPVKFVDGKLLVTGLEQGETFTDQKPLDLIHNIKRYAPITAVLPDAEKARRHLMSRSARYSGLLSVLELSQDVDDAIQGAQAWLALNAPIGDLGGWIEKAKSSGVKTFVATTTGVGKEQRGEVAAVKRALQAAADQGMRVSVLLAGGVTEAEEEQLSSDPFEVLRLSSPSSSAEEKEKEIDWNSVDLDKALTSADSKMESARKSHEERVKLIKARNDTSLPVPVLEVKSALTKEEDAAVLCRAGAPKEEVVRCAAEALTVDAAANCLFCVGTGDEAAAFYLRSLRKRGLTTRQEMEQVFSGGLQRWRVNEALKRGEEERLEAEEAVKERERAQRDAANAENEINALFAKSAEQRRLALRKKMETKARKLLEEQYRSEALGSSGISEEDFVEENLESKIDDLMKKEELESLMTSAA